MLIELYTDLGCPWCFIATWRTEAVLAKVGKRASLVHRAFVVDPTLPEGGRNILQLMQARYGGTPPALAEAEAQARQSGVPFNFQAQPIAYPTIKAQILLRYAIAGGRQRELAQDLFRANFVAGANIADSDVLVDIAARHGFSRHNARELIESPTERALTLEEADAARAAGVHSVPTFVFAQRDRVVGTQSEAALLERIEQHLKSKASA